MSIQTLDSESPRILSSRTGPDAVRDQDWESEGAVARSAKMRPARSRHRLLVTGITFLLHLR